MHKAALCQFNFESVLALRFGAAQGSFRGGAKIRGARGFAGESAFSFAGPPRPGPNTAESDPHVRHISARDAEHHGCRGQGEFVGRPVAQLEIYLPASCPGRRQADMSDEIPRLEHGFSMWCGSRQKMKVAKGDLPRAFLSLYV